jgi:hypothetical protein
LSLESRGLKSRPDLETRLWEFDWSAHIEEARSLADLLKVSASERLLDDDVQQILGDRVMSVLELVIELDLALGRLFNDDGVSRLLEEDWEIHVILKFLDRVDLTARYHILTKSCVKRPPLEVADLMDQAGVPHLHAKDV